MKELVQSYQKKKSALRKKLREFSQTGKQPEDKIFSELVFCILTPQSNALSCDKAMQEIMRNNLLLHGTEQQIAKVLQSKTRFHKNKAKYIIRTREKFMENGTLSFKKQLLKYKTPEEKRLFLEKHVVGLGLKESGHFLRNIGMAGNLAILDRHILRNLHEMGIIDNAEVKGSKDYFKKEKQMQKFAKSQGIPMQELDLLFWSNETGVLHK